MGRVRLRRWAAGIAAAYLGIVVVANATIFLGVLIARMLGHSPEVDDDLPDIRNLRRVDDKVYASGQPDAPHYELLADRGFELVIDLRRHVRSDPQRDDPDRIASLGLEYVHVPLIDGSAPSEGAVDRVLAAIERTNGKVLLHCGGGVGRSTAMAAAYLASQGENPSVLDQLGVGPPTLEQIHFVAATGSNDPYADSDVVNFVSRYVIDGPRRLWHTLTGI
jgi:protein tyrosine phosphatase (PTP) superfamily phosphohydrolase (DUF442 family)